MRKLAWTGIVALAMTVSVPATAADIDTTPFMRLGVGAGGNTRGQTFTVAAGDTVLSSFSLFLNANILLPDGAVNKAFRGHVGTWNGAGVGSLLYSSGDRQLVRGAPGISLSRIPTPAVEFNFLTNLVVTPGQQYVAFLSQADVSQLGVVDGSGFLSANSSGVVDALPGGDWVQSFDTGGLANIANWIWSSPFSKPVDHAFKATFSSVVNPGIPEPATWAMMLFGFGAVGGALRKANGRRRGYLPV